MNDTQLRQHSSNTSPNAIIITIINIIITKMELTSSEDR